MAQRQESKDSIVGTHAAEKARADAAEAKNAKLLKDLEAARADAGVNADAARKRRSARTDAPDKHTFAITKERADMGVKTGLGTYTKPGEPEGTDGDAEAARARRISRTTR